MLGFASHNQQRVLSMDGCSLFALIACLSWSNVYVDSGLSWQDTSAPHQELTTITTDLGGVIETVTTPYTTDRPFNPYGRIAIGYELRFSNLTLALEAAHVSSLTESDRGINAIGLKARWYPFRQ
jgi:hypothetical protein